MGCYPASGDNFLPKFRGNVSVPSAGLKNPKESLLFQYGVLYTEECGLWKVSLSANWVDACGWEGDIVGSNYCVRG